MLRVFMQLLIWITAGVTVFFMHSESFFIDGEIYPVSHIISDHWEIAQIILGLRDRHRLMASDPSLQEQEKKFTLILNHVSV